MTTADLLSKTMSPEEFKAKWTAFRRVFSETAAMVDGVTLCDSVLSDFDAMMAADAETPLTLTAAAEHSGYSAGHLSRLVQTGVIPNAGRTNTPRIRRADLPIKPGHLPALAASAHILASSKRQIVRSVADPERGTR